MTKATKFIAEVSSNHHRDLKRSLRFIDVAADIGCDAVKFQLFRVEELFAPEILQNSEEHRKRAEWEMPLEFLPILANHAEKCGIEFSCTPFYLDAVDELSPFVDFYKIASYELLWSDLISACCRTGKPVILSTGMALLEEVEAAVKGARDSGCKDLSVLHCVSGYPTPLDECNLSVINTIKTQCGCPVGWSDHTVSPAVLYRAINKWDASIIEFHSDLDGMGAEFMPGHCWLPDQIEQVIRNVRLGFQTDGNGKKQPTASEIADRDWRTDPSDGLRPMKKMRQV